MKNTNISLVIGFHAVEDLLQSDITVGKVYVNAKADKQKVGVLRKLTKERNVPLQMVPIEKLNRLTRANHQGVIAFKSPIDYVPLEETITRMYEAGKMPKIVVADGIQDIRNIGAIARNCMAFDVDLLVVGTKANAEIGEGAIKSSAGALLKLPVARVRSLAETLDYLKNWGIRQIGTNERAETVLEPGLVNKSDAWALWMGNENKGLSRERVALLDKLVRIPMSSSIDSLNVSVAAGIALYCLYSTEPPHSQ